MKKVYSAVKLPQEAIDILEDNEIELTMHDELTTPSEDEIIEKVKDVDALISGVNVEVTSKVIEANENMKIIANIGAGTNNLDIDKAEEKGIVVSKTPGRDSVASTAELAIGLMLAVSRNILKNQDMVNENSFDGWQVMGFLGSHQVSYKNLLIIGFGNIGQEIAKMAKAFHMDINYYDIKDRSEFKEAEEETSAKYVELEEGLKNADYVILQMNYTDENYHFIDKDKLSLMKEDAYLINTARGDVLDEEVLADYLEEGKLAGAGLDVHENEPKMNERLIKMDKAVLTPHIGNDTYEARVEMSKAAAEEVVRALNGDEVKYKA